MSDAASILPETILSVTAAADAARLDRLLAAELPDFSRSRLQALIAAGHVRRAGHTIIDPAARVKQGEVFEIHVPPAEAAEPEGQDIPLAVVYEDADLIVIDKPAGLVVHPAAGNPDGTLVNALIAHCGDSLSGIGGVKRPGIVHRIDKDTSGLMVAAKTDAAHAGLAAQFAAHDMERAYLALVWGLPRPPSGEMSGAIGRSPQNRQKMAIVTRGGKHALTRYRTVETFGDMAALVECRLATGRTHQIRVHMTALGHPLIGDSTYGRPRRAAHIPALARDFPRQALHAATLGFRHPVTGRDLRFSSPLPADLQALADALRAAS